MGRHCSCNEPAHDNDALTFGEDGELIRLRLADPRATAVLRPLPGRFAQWLRGCSR